MPEESVRVPSAPNLYEARSVRSPSEMDYDDDGWVISKRYEDVGEEEDVTFVDDIAFVQTEIVAEMICEMLNTRLGFIVSTSQVSRSTVLRELQSLSVRLRMRVPCLDDVRRELDELIRKYADCSVLSNG